MTVHQCHKKMLRIFLQVDCKYICVSQVFQSTEVWFFVELFFLAVVSDAFICNVLGLCFEISSTL